MHACHPQFENGLSGSRQERPTALAPHKMLLDKPACEGPLACASSGCQPDRRLSASRWTTTRRGVVAKKLRCRLRIGTAVFCARRGVMSAMLKDAILVPRRGL